VSKALDRVRVGLLGIAAGLMIAVFYLRNQSVASDALDHLRDGALLLLAASVILSVLQLSRQRTARRG
jgi:formate-dependent nitrite reductase membrane component NrfD